jgi:uncharacterized repeat protein (TIGR01451 family)
VLQQCQVNGTAEFTTLVRSAGTRSAGENWTGALCLRYSFAHTACCERRTNHGRHSHRQLKYGEATMAEAMERSIDVRAVRPSAAGRGRRPPHPWLARALLALALLFAPLASATVGVTLNTSNMTPVAGGAAFSYTIVVTNNDTVNPATNVSLTLPLPPGIVIANSNVSVVENSSVNPPAGTSRGFFTCTSPAIGENGVVTCTAPSFPASLMAINTTSTIVVVVQALADLAGGVRTATVRVATGGTSVTASQGVTIANNASLTIDKVATPTAVRGSTVAYTLSASNSGSSSAVNVIVSDALPATTTFVSVFATGALHNNCTYNPGTHTVSCTAGFMPLGTSQVTILVRTTAATPLGMLSNTATISAAVGNIAVGMDTANTNITP